MAGVVLMLRGYLWLYLPIKQMQMHRARASLLLRSKSACEMYLQ